MNRKNHLEVWLAQMEHHKPEDWVESRQRGALWALSMFCLPGNWFEATGDGPLLYYPDEGTLLGGGVQLEWVQRGFPFSRENNTLE